MSRMDHRRSYAQDLALKVRVFELLEGCFPGIGEQAERISLPGSAWELTSTPFVVEDSNGQPIAHVGLLCVPVVMRGERQVLGAVHAVCTHPAHRRKGCCRILMEEVITFAEEVGQTLMLTTSQPSIYERFGFRVVPEYRFDVTVDSAGSASGFRPMSLRDEGDLALLTDLLDKRQPVSDIFGVTGEERGSFSFYCPDPGLWYAPELDTIAWLEIQDKTLRICDIVAPRIPPLAEMLQLTPFAVDRVEILFSPDRLQAEGVAVPYRYEGGYLMIRGPLAAEGEKFMVPPASRC